MRRPGIDGLRRRTPWGWVWIPLLVALPEELLQRASRLAGARGLAALSECCTTVSAAVARIAQHLLAEVHAVDGVMAPAIPRLRRWHMVERMADLASCSLAVLKRPVVLVGDDVGLAPISTGGGGQGSSDLLVLRMRDCLPDLSARVVSIASGRHHVVFLDSFGRAWAAGDPKAGGVTLDCASPPAWGRGGELLSPAPVKALWGVRLVKVACGNGHSVAMAANGDVFTWGRDLAAAGDAADAGAYHWPDPSKGLAGEAVDVAAGESHIAAVSLTGDTYAWGQNHHGQCASDPGANSCNSYLPAPSRCLGALASAVARRTSCGRYHTAVLSVDGTVCTFGAGLSGQLGRPTKGGDSWKPEQVLFEGCREGGSPVLIVQVACGDQHTMCLTDTGRVIAFGSGDHGQLGLGGVRSHRLPVPVRTLSSVREVAAGADWTLFACRGPKIYLAGRGEDSAEDSRFLRQLAGPSR